MSDVFELQRVDEGLEALCHLRRGVWVDDEYGAHLGVSWVVATVAVFTHWGVGELCCTCFYLVCPAMEFEDGARDGDADVETRRDTWDSMRDDVTFAVRAVNTE